jgi:hypothetical protein
MCYLKSRFSPVALAGGEALKPLQNRPPGRCHDNPLAQGILENGRV